MTDNADLEATTAKMADLAQERYLRGVAYREAGTPPSSINPETGFEFETRSYDEDAEQDAVAGRPHWGASFPVPEKQPGPLVAHLRAAQQHMERAAELCDGDQRDDLRERAADLAELAAAAERLS